MVAKLEYGNLSIPSTEADTISIRIIDERNFPSYLIAKIVNKDGAKDTRYTTGDEIDVREFSITDNPVIFRGKIQNVLKSVENSTEILTITARDNLAELTMPFNSATYTENGADATINAIIRGHVKNVSDNFALPAVGSNTAAYESSANTNAVEVIGNNNGRSVLKTIQDLAAEDPHASSYQSTQNAGWHFYLDGGADMHYHSYPYPSGASSNSLVLTFGLASASVNDYTKQILPTPSYSKFDADIVSEVYAHYQYLGEAKVVRLKLITHGTVGGSGSPFAAGNNITGTAEGGSGTATAQIRLILSGAMLISHATDYTAEPPNFNPGATITDASSGATATYTTTSGQETDKAQPVHLRRSTLVFTAGTEASALTYTSQTAYAVLRAGFIDISADTHRKATVKIFDFPIMRRSGTTTVLRPGNTIFVTDNITQDDLQQDFIISKIEYVQEGGRSISSLSLTTDEGSPLLLSGVEKVGNIAKDVGIEAVGAIQDTSNKYTASDGTYSAPSVTFAGSADGHTGLYLYETGATEMVGITADGATAALFGENGTGIWLYETVTPGADDFFDLGSSSYRWDDVYATNGTIQTSDMRLKELITPLTLGLDFVNDLNPVSYKWKNKKEDKVNQTHYGIIAQEVMETLKKHGINSIEEFGGITHGGEDEDYYGARYSEFIPMLIKAVQELSDEVKQLKEKN